MACGQTGSPRRTGFSTVYAPAPPAGADGGVSDAGADGGVSDAAADGGVAGPALLAIEGTGAGDGWAVGEQGIALRLSAGTWRAVPSGRAGALAGLTALDVNHAFAVERGAGTVLAWSGGSWSPLGGDGAGRAATWASAANDVWAVGDGIEHWDGHAWAPVLAPGTGAFTAVAGSFRTDAWAVGPAGVRRFNGTDWLPVTVPATTPALAAVWASSPFDVWIVGAQSTVLHWNGSTLSALAPPGDKVDLTAVSGSSATDVWIGGGAGTLLNWDGGGWSRLVTPSAQRINDLWTTLGEDVFLVDTTGAILRYVR